MTKQRITFSSDQKDFDLTKIVNEIQETKWGNSRSEERIVSSIMQSFCMIAKVDSQQIGFIRVVNDGEFFAYIADIIISEKFQRQNYGSMLIKATISEKSLCGIDNWLLRTRDAHAFFEKVGFSVAVPDRLMTARKQVLAKNLSKLNDA